MKSIKMYSEYLVVSILFVFVCFLYIIVFKVLFKFHVGMGSFPDYFNVVVMYVTALVIYQYTKETKRLADYEYIQQIPIIGHLIRAEFIDHDTYHIIPTIVNHTKYPVSVYVYVSLIYALDTKIEIVNEQDKVAYNGKRVWLIPPHGAFQGHLRIGSKLTKFTEETKSIMITESMFADNLAIKIKYHAKCKHSNMDFISDEYPYKFRLDKLNNKIDLIPELIFPD